MKCPTCGKTNPDGMRFCVDCGTPLTTESISIPSANKPPSGSMPGLENDDILPNEVTPAEGEKTVRTYLCTYHRSRLLNIKAHGRLSVTNKRVIFRAFGSSSSGPSIIQSEIPIENVSGLQSFKGTYFSLKHLIGIILLSSIIGFLCGSLISLLGTENAAISKAIGWILGVASLAFSFFVSHKKVWQSVLVFLSASLIGATGAGSLINVVSSMMNPLAGLFGVQSSPDFGFYMVVILVIAIEIYGFYCAFKYSRRPNFSLSINSTGGGNAPINISGGGIGLLSPMASKAFTAEPARDSEQLLAELGALILDIQKMGDFGIEKWGRH